MSLRLQIDRASPDSAVISRAIEVLRAHGVVAFPTDTFYGLAADPRDPRGARRIFELKSRDARAALPLIAGNLSQAMAAGEFNRTARRLAERWWPGPLTLVVPAREAVATETLATGDTVAVRIPDHAVARALALALGFCVTSTSANPSGTPPAASADDVLRLVPGVDVVLDAGPSRGNAPSTIVAVRGETITLLREGAVPWDRVLESLQ